jgi:hypothetical protein
MGGTDQVKESAMPTNPARPTVVALALAIVTLAAVGPRAATAGAAPPNDDFPGTTISSLPYETTVDTTEATSEAQEPYSFCAYDATNTVWWTYTPATNATLRASASGAEHPPVLTVWQDSAFGLSEVTCDGDPGWPAFPGDPFPEIPPRLDVSVLFQAEEGTTYYIQIGGYEDDPFFPFGFDFPPGGEVTFSLTKLVPPANDDVANAEAVISLPFSDEIDTAAATEEADEPKGYCFPEGAISIFPSSTVWYSYTASEDMELLVDTLASDYLPFMAVWTGTPGNLTEVTCNSHALTFNAESGTTYYIQAGQVGFEDFLFPGGVLRIIIDEYEQPECPRNYASVDGSPR